MRQERKQSMSLHLAERCASIKLLVLDVDGVLTDGSIVYAGAEVEVKTFHVRDGSGLKLWQQEGKQAALISGRRSAAVERRAAELGITPVVQGVGDKLAAFRQLLAATGRTPDEVCALGDDVLDLPLLRRAGLAIAVADACSEVRQVAHHVTQAPGGRGAVREAIELILRCQGAWQRVLERLLAL
jgi:3-deoxy-D-manno-octulosonate 8-phosphate phosphatase (KDO 8-P phosphatase)